MGDHEYDAVQGRDRPPVSIIIDNYNYACFVREAIDSALAQTYRDVQVIVVDDGSTDDSRTVLAAYGDRIEPVFKDNGGQASAFNAGLAQCRGEVVLFLDADDTLSPRAVEHIVPFFSDCRVSKVHWPLEVVNEQGRRTGQLKPVGTLPHGDLRRAVLDKGPSHCLSSPTSGNAWSRWFLECVSPVPEDVAYYRTCADEYLYTLAPVFGEIRAIRESLGTYRVHPRSIYSAKSFVDKLRLELQGHDEQCAALGPVLERSGIQPNISAWRWHSWFHRLQDSLQQLDEQLAPSDKFVLVDDDTWGASQIFAPDRVLPFSCCQDAYWGPPADDDAATEWLALSYARGARFLVFAWPSFWWLDHYAGFRGYLEERFACLVRNDRLIVYDLRCCVDAWSSAQLSESPAP